SDARTAPGERCALAHRGWAGEKDDFFSILLEESARSDKGVKVIHRARWCGQGNHERLRIVADVFKVLRGQRQFFLCQIGDSVWNACRRERAHMGLERIALFRR